MAKHKISKNPWKFHRKWAAIKKIGLCFQQKCFPYDKDYISYQILNPCLECKFSFFHLGFHSLDVWFIFSNGIYSIQDWAVTTEHRVKKKQDGKGKKHIEKLIRKSPRWKMPIATLETKPFRSLLKEKHSRSIESQSLTVRGRKLLT